MANPNPSPETRFQKGNPGGPGGRRGKRLSTLLIEVLEADDEAAAKALISALLRGAKKGRIAHIREVFDRVEGKVTQPIEAAVSGVALSWPDDREPDPGPDDAAAPPGPGGGAAVEGEEPTLDRGQS